MLKIWRRVGLLINNKLKKRKKINKNGGILVILLILIQIKMINKIHKNIKYNNVIQFKISQFWIKIKTKIENN